MKRDPFVKVTPDHDNPGMVILTVYEAGSGATLARKPLNAAECARLVEKLIQPLVAPAMEKIQKKHTKRKYTEHNPANFHNGYHP